MPEESTATTSSHLSIGEVLGLLLEEFPDITISKIRFLESQGLIEPERTASGYRKFYEPDVELLRCILREQKDNFLPLKVIKDRLDTGEIDPTNETQRPAGLVNVADDQTAGTPVDGSLGASRHPAAASNANTNHSVSSGGAAHPPQAGDDTGDFHLPSGVVLDAAEICSMSGLSNEQLEQVRSYGVIVPADDGTFDEDALEIARIAKRFLTLGVDARHIRGWKVAADREAGLFEQVIQPLLRQRNPESNEHAVAQLTELATLGGQLRGAMMRTLLRRHLEH
ncbi:transcriptional regulator FtsR [Ilumatobacter nonamiensis]|uniref:transcriptional regulator FtsR n=1 Tax=Ilumatobacter nonamiensis TaxID=467093 RepID=UPI0003457EE6|nr:MerR family transcriptional regulator [Ilumatobacter nonamiensis]